MGKVNKKWDKNITILAFILIVIIAISRIATEGIHFSASMGQIIGVLPLLIILGLVFIIMKLEPDLISMKSYLIFAGLWLFIILLSFMGIAWKGGQSGPDLPSVGGMSPTIWIIFVLLVVIAVSVFFKIKGRNKEEKTE